MLSLIGNFTRFYKTKLLSCPFAYLIGILQTLLLLLQLLMFLYQLLLLLHCNFHILMDFPQLIHFKTDEQTTEKENHNNNKLIQTQGRLFFAPPGSSGCPLLCFRSHDRFQPLSTMSLLYSIP